MSRIDSYNGYTMANQMYDRNRTQKKEAVEQSQTAGANRTAPKLSEKAKKLLEELKEKYKNADFMVADYSSDEEAQAIMSRGTKEYSVLLEPDTLEKMADDEDVKKKYMDQIEDATSTLSEIRKKLEREDGIGKAFFGITISGDGTVLFFATLQRSSELQKDRIENSKETKVTGNSVEELLDKIKKIDWDKVPATKTAQGSKIDVSV